MKNLLIYTILLLSPFLFTSSQMPISNDLADELVGVYTGMFAKDGSLDKTYQVKVSKLDANTIQITPFSNSTSKTFKAELKEDNLSAIRIIRLTSKDGVILKNGMMTPVNGRLSYGIASDAGENLEVFSGLKK